jgi:hypothetical protein
MDSWTKKDYADAIDAGAIKLAEERSLEEMFYYAGGSVRLLQWHREYVIQSLTKRISQVKDFSRLVGSGGIGEYSEDAVNSLMAIYGRKSVILSQFVSVTLFDKVADGFISDARICLWDNPVWQGWVTVIEVLRKLKGTKGIRLQKPPSADVEPVGGQVKIIYDSPDAPSTSIEFWKSVREPLLFEDHTDKVLRDVLIGWFLPVRWNQACFDALYRPSEHHLRVVQITDAPTHFCKLRHVIPFVKAMNIHTVEFVFICREKNFATFEVPMPNTTRLRQVLETNAAKAAEVAEAAGADNVEAPAKKQRVDNMGEDVSDKEQKAGGGGRRHATRSQEEHDAIIFRKVCYEIHDQDVATRN